jgi:hypothetical protein
MALFPQSVGIYGGMTVNERLFTAGTLEQFDSAVRHGDRTAMVALLVAVEIDCDQAEKIADTMLSHPTRYGRV